MSLSAAAIEAVKNNASVQQEVRDIIANYNGPETLIAKEITIFRRDIEGWIDQASGSAETKLRRKQVNNIINDVSRICRELIGKSIVCTSRKNHTYEAKEPVARTTRAKTPSPVLATNSPITADDDAETCLQTIRMLPKGVQSDIRRGLVLDNPEAAMNTLMQELGADKFMEIVRSAVASIK